MGFKHLPLGRKSDYVLEIRILEQLIEFSLC